MVSCPGEHILPHRGVASAEPHQCLIRQYINSALGHHDLDKVLPMVIQSWETALLNNGV